MPGHRPLAEEEGGGDLLVRAPRSDEAQHLHLTSGEPGRERGRLLEVAGHADVEGGAELVEDGLGGGEGSDGAVLVAGDAAGLAQQEPCGGHLVGDVERAPPLERLPQGGAGGSRVPPCQAEASARRCCGGVECRALEVGCDGLQLLGCGPRRSEVLAGHGDLHPGRQQLGAREPVPGLLVERAHDDRRGGVESTLGQAQQGQPGLGPPAQRLGLPERALRSFEVAEPATHLAELHEARRGVGGAHLAQLRTGSNDLVLGLRPVSSALQGPGAMHPAQPGEHGEGVALRPLRRCVGPLGGAAVVAELLAGADQAAVDLARRVRTEAALDCEEHRFVEVPEPFCRATFVHQYPTKGLQRLGLQIGHVQAPAEVDDITRLLGGGSQLPAAVCDLDLPQDEVAVLDALDVAVQSMPGPPQPCATDAGLGLEAEVLVEPDGALCRTAVGVARLEHRIHGLPRRNALVQPTQPPSGLGADVEALPLAQAVEVGDTTGYRGLVGHLPIVARKGVTRALQRSLVVVVRSRPLGAHAPRR